MALRLDKSVVMCEIDNRLKDHVMGKIWVFGRNDPVKLNLKGNCLRDIAGQRVVFENPSPAPGNNVVDLAPFQEGIAGEMTASRKVKVTELTPEEAMELRKEKKEIPLCTANSLYLEWFGEQNGRVVIELTNFKIKEISDPAWRMSKEEELIQIEENRLSIREYVNHESESPEDDSESWCDEEYKPMDEFEWEKFMKESDTKTDKYSGVFEKYIDYPDGEKLMVREMGWEWLDDALDADERGAFNEEKKLKEPEDFPPLEPNPFTEGKDWIRADDGDIKHPLSHRAFKLSTDTWHECEKAGLLGENGDKDLREMIFQAQVLSAKLAGALNHLAYDSGPEGGFIVACLKRALQYFEGSIAASERVKAKKLLSAQDLENFRRELFAIREEILRLMNNYRSRI